MGYFKKTVTKMQKGGSVPRADLSENYSTNYDIGKDSNIYGREDIYPKQRPIDVIETSLDNDKGGRMLDSELESMGGNDLSKYVGELIGRRLIPDEKMAEVIDLLRLHNTGKYGGDPTYPNLKGRSGYSIEGENIKGVDPDTYDADKENMPQIGGMWGKYAAIDKLNSTLGLPKNQESIMTGRATMDELNRKVGLRGGEDEYNKYIQEESDRILGKDRGAEAVKSKINMDDSAVSQYIQRRAEKEAAHKKEMEDFEKMYRQASNPTIKDSNKSSKGTLTKESESESVRMRKLKQWEDEQELEKLANANTISPKIPYKASKKKAEGGKVKVYAEGGKLASSKVVEFYDSLSPLAKGKDSFKINGKTFTVKK